MTDSWKEIKQIAKCINLLEYLLREEEFKLFYLKEHGHETRATEYKIARIKYALGEISTPPRHRDYFNINETKV